MSSNNIDISDDYGFRFLDNVDNPAVKLIAVGKQEIYSNKYYWENKNRQPFYLFQYTLNGSGSLKADNQIHTIKKGDAFFLKTPNDDIYYFDDEKNEAPWKFVYIIFEGQSAFSYYNYIISHFGNIFHLSEYDPAVKLLLDLHNNAKNGLISNAFLADSEVFRFLCLLCDTNSRNQQLTIVSKAKEYMEKNFALPITLAQTAEQLGVSQSHLSREFTKHTGEQPIHYLSKIRIEKAIQMLISTDMNLNKISRLCGFSDRNYFCKVFKKYIKLSPGEFRRQIKAQGYISFKV